MAVNMNKLVRALEICEEEATQRYVEYVCSLLCHDGEDLNTAFESPTFAALKAKAEVFTDLLDVLRAMEYKNGMDKS